MPELPEVETVKRGLNSLIIGKTINQVNSDNFKSFPNASSEVKQFLIGAKIINISRRAKVLLIALSTHYTLVIHLKMTGQLVFVDNKKRFGAGHPSDSLINRLPDKSTRVIFDFDDGSHLYFNDQRKFGWVRLVPTKEVPEIDFMRRVGPEPLETDFSAEQFVQRLKKRSGSNIKAVLLDQSIIAGVGNIYADESLWGARLHPAILVKNISTAKFKLLYLELRAVMNLSIEKGGSTNRNYVNAEGKKGSYMDFAKVFRREGLACPRCQTEIIKLRVASRGTHICPRCQRLK